MIWVATIGFAVVIVVAIAWLRGRSVNRTPDEVATYLRDFIDGTGGDWDWDDFTSIPISDPALERIRAEAELVQLPTESVGRLRELLHQAEALAAERR